MSDDTGSSSSTDNPFMDVMIGCAIVSVTTLFIWFVESIAVKFQLILHRCQVATRVIKDITKIDPDYQSRPILVRGKSKQVGEPIANKDTDTGFVVDTHNKNVIRLKRIVEMYQWQEKSHTKKGKHGNSTTYTYHLVWSEIDYDSSTFHISHNQPPQQQSNMMGRGGNIQYNDNTSSTYTNPSRSPDMKSTITNSKCDIGAYTLSERQIEMMNDFKKCDILSTKLQTSNMKKNSPLPQIEIDNDKKITYLIYKPSNVGPQCSLSHPEVGLVRCSYRAIYENSSITTVGVQANNTFRPYTDQDAHKTNAAGCCGCKSNNNSGTGYRAAYTDEEIGGEYDDDGLDGAPEPDTTCCERIFPMAPIIEQLAGGIIGKDVMLLEEIDVPGTSIFHSASNFFVFRLWICRAISVLLMAFGFGVIFSFITNGLDMIPYIGGWFSSFFAGFVTALAILYAMLLISIAWISSHPEYLFVLLALIGGLCVSNPSSDFWLYFGFGSLVCSIYPVYIYIMNWVEECAFQNTQANLDREHRQHLRERQNGNGTEMNERSRLK
jgi:hypothetical protein